MEIITGFLERFVMASDSAKKKDQIDLKLVLKALPKKIDEFNVDRCDNFQFESMQTALIDFENGDHVTLQKYFDRKNKSRLNKLYKKAKMTEDMTCDLKMKSAEVMDILRQFEEDGPMTDQHQRRMNQIQRELDEGLESIRVQIERAQALKA